ncbi:MAG: pitrilysin family protein [Bacteroidota bacterium]
MSPTAPVAPHPQFDYVREVGGIEEVRHRENGLTVLLLQQAAAPVVTFMVTYGVGSRNEHAGLTGATHLLEHLMFKGTERFNKAAGQTIFNVLQRVGAQVNATTWYDRTNYYALLPKEHLGLAVEIEADRMRGALVRDEDLASERTVVLNELDRGENEPLRKLLHAVWSVAYVAHPYGHPTIGWRSDVETVEAADLRHFYDTYYWPSNATVSVIGDFDRAEALALVHQHFGCIPAGPSGDGAPGAEPLVSPQSVTREPPQIGERRLVIRQAGQLGAVLCAYKAPAGLDADADALDVLATALTSGKSSRLYRRLTDEGLTTSTFAFFPRLRDPGLFMVYGALAPDATHATVESTLRDLLAEIAAEGLTDAELERARRQTVAQDAFGRDGPYAIASQLNEAIAVGDWTLYATYRDRIASVTAADVQRVAAQVFRADRLTVGHYVPEPGDS